MSYLSTVQQVTATVLRDYPELRDIDSRAKVWLRVRCLHPSAKFSTVERCCRKIQNEHNKYLPERDDGRRKKEEEYRRYFNNNIII